jgi:hypothetical protein
LTAISRTAARLSFAAAATFLVLLAALHFIKPELDPSWRMVSEYEIGRYGWVILELRVRKSRYIQVTSGPVEAPHRG